MQAAAVVKTLLKFSTKGAIPREFLTTNRILERWAVDSNDGLPTDQWDDDPRSRAVPLDPDTWLVVDGQVRSLPESNRKVVVYWYTKPWPTATIASKLRLTRENLYVAHGLVLNFMKYRLEKTGHQPILRMLKLRMDAE